MLTSRTVAEQAVDGAPADDAGPRADHGVNVEPLPDAVASSVDPTDTVGRDLAALIGPDVEQVLGETLRRVHDDLRVLRTVLDGLEDAVVLVDVPDPIDIDTGAGGIRFLYANAAAVSALGTTPDVLVGASFQEVLGIVAAHVLGEVCAEALREGHPVTERLLSVGDDGVVQDAREVTASPVGGRRVVVQSRDVTRQEWDR